LAGNLAADNQNATKFAKSSRVKTGKESSMFRKGWGFGRQWSSNDGQEFREEAS
jgi:hypothetical protein